MGRSPTRFTLPCDPVVKRQARLDALLTRFDCAAVLMFKSFDDGAALPPIAEKHKQQRLNEDRACGCQGETDLCGAHLLNPPR